MIWAFNKEREPTARDVLSIFSFILRKTPKVSYEKTSCYVYDNLAERYVMIKDIDLESDSDDLWVVYDINAAIYWLIEYLKRKW